MKSEAPEQKMSIKPIPKHKNAVSIVYEDTWNGDVFCPFCGMKAIAFVMGEIEAMTCPHIFFAEAHGQVLLASPAFLESVNEIIADSSKKILEDCETVSWPAADDDDFFDVSLGNFCSVFPNSITITTLDSQTGEEMTVGFAPVNAPRSSRLSVISNRKID